MTKSLWEDRDFDLRDDFPFAIPTEPTVSHVALGQKGKIFPKHAPFLSALAVPFYALFGFPGFLIFTLVVYGGIFSLFFTVVPSRLLSWQAGIFTLYFCMPLFFHYLYNFGPDVVISFFVLASWILLVKEKGFLSGLISGLTVFLRPVYGLLVLQNFFFSSWKKGYSFGAILGLLPFLAYNTYAFGLPWVTGYARTLYQSPDGLKIFDHTTLFSFTPHYIFPLLFHFPQGLIFSSPFTVVVLALALKRRWKEKDSASLYFLLLFGWHLLWYACYLNLAWESSSFGIRYLLPLSFFAPLVLFSPNDIE